jgi:hypothetical protein
MGKLGRVAEAVTDCAPASKQLGSTKPSQRARPENNQYRIQMPGATKAGRFMRTWVPALGRPAEKTRTLTEKGPFPSPGVRRRFLVARPAGAARRAIRSVSRCRRFRARPLRTPLRPRRGPRTPLRPPRPGAPQVPRPAPSDSAPSAPGLADSAPSDSARRPVPVSFAGFQETESAHGVNSCALIQPQGRNTRPLRQGENTTDSAFLANVFRKRGAPTCFWEYGSPTPRLPGCPPTSDRTPRRPGTPRKSS